MKSFFVFLILVSTCNLCCAEIIKTINTFDKSVQTISFFKIRNSDYPETIILKKIENEYYFLAKKPSRRTNYLSNLEKPKVKIDDNIFSLDRKIYDYDYYQHFSFKFSNEIINKIKTAGSIIFQMPVLVHENIFIDYYNFSISQPILDEWKQVITME